MTRRDVDSQVLRHLAQQTARSRGELEATFNTARRRVDGAPGGWDRGRWEGIPSFMRMELESLDREQRELNERAAKIELAAAVAALPEPLPLSAWKFILAAVTGLAGWAFASAADVQDFVAKVAAFSKQFAEKNGKSPSGMDFASWGGATMGGLGLILGLTKRDQPPATTGTNRFHGKVVVGGKTLTDAELFDRARGIRQAYLNALGRPPTDVEYEVAMRSGKTIQVISDQLRQPSIDVPFQSQWNGTNGGANCGPASLVMAVGALGKNLSYDAVVSSVRNRDDDNPSNDVAGYTDFKSHDYDQVLKMAGLQQAPVTTLAGVEEALRAGSPIVIAVDTRQWSEVPYFRRDGMVTNHIVVITGIKDGHVIVNDPLATKYDESGAVVPDATGGTGFKVPVEEFLRSVGGDGSLYASAISRQ